MDTKIRIGRWPSVTAILAGSLLLGSQTLLAADEHAGHNMSQAADEHAGHDMSKMSGGDHAQHSMEKDELGRTLYGMEHKMDPKLVDELRGKVALYKGATDAQIALSMEQMGAEYAWYVSPPDVKGTQGVLVLMHGFREAGDRMFKQQLEPLGKIFPTAMGVGMAMMMSDHIQVALDQLVAAGAKDIAVVPVVSSKTNELYRQWLYIFGEKPEAEYASVPRVKTSAKIHFVEPPGSSGLVVEILGDYAAEISKDPSKEVVIIAGHGPSSADDNEEELQVLGQLAKAVKQDGGYSDVKAITLQDDAPPPVRAANVAKLRKLVEDATASGKRVLVVTNLIGARTIQAKLRDDLQGLDYEFYAKGISQHDNFKKWINESVREVFEET